MPKNIQFIGLQVKTQPKRKEEFTSLSNEVEDVQARVILLKQSLDALKEHPKIEKNVLKILTLPQLFFRGENGAYQFKTIFENTEDSKGLLASLQELCMDKKWANWIFNFGTIVGYSVEKFSEEDEKEETTEEEEKEQASTDDSIEELLRKAQQNGAALPHEDYQQVAVDDSLDALLEKATNNRKLEEKVARETETKDEEESGEKVEEETSEPTEEIKDIVQISIILEGGFGTLKKAIPSTQLVVTPYKSDIEFSVDNDDELKMVVDIDEEDDEYLLYDECHLDHWKLIKGTGELDKEKFNSFHKTSKRNHLAELCEKLEIPVSVKKDFLNMLVPLGIFELNKLNFALDMGLEHMYQVTKKVLEGLTDRQHKIKWKKLFPKNTIRTLQNSLKKGVDIHIVSSYGTEIHANAVLSKKEGYLVNAISLTDTQPLEVYEVKKSFLEAKEEEKVLIEKLSEEQEVCDINSKDIKIVAGENSIKLAELFAASDDENAIKFYIQEAIKL